MKMKNYILISIFVYVFNGILYSQINPLDSGLVAYYPFNGNANDESGNGNNGIVNSATLTTDRFDNTNSAYEFDGIDDFITIPNSPELVFGSNDFTIVSWIYPVAYTGKKGLNAIITKHDYDDGSWLFRVRKHSSTGNIPKLNFETDFPTHRYYGNTEVTINNWHMAAVIRSGNNYSFYFDENIDGTFTDDESFTTTYPIVISGQGDNCTDERFTGKIDDIRIYNRALSGLEIQQLYDSSDYITFDITVFMEGPYIINQMIPYLNTFGFLPLFQPYYTSPWNYPGAESVITIPNSDIIDWILIELRETTGDSSTATSDSIIARQAGFLLNNGKIAGMDGSSLLRFSVEVSDSLYAIIHHRNHFPIMSAYPLSESNGIYTYNFTDSEDKAYGGSLAHKQIAPGTWGMIAGDGNADGQIDNIDKDDVWLTQKDNTGYYSADFNMDVIVSTTDKVMMWQPNAGKGSKVPDNVPDGGYKCMVPE